MNVQVKQNDAPHDVLHLKGKIVFHLSVDVNYIENCLGEKQSFQR